jgi:hypothetical protein
VAFVAFLPKPARVWGLPDPATWPLVAMDAMVGAVVSLSKRLAQDATFYAPFVQQIWRAIEALESVPRAVWVVARTPEAQVAGAVVFIVAVAAWLTLRPSRTRERGIGHACLSF